MSSWAPLALTSITAALLAIPVTPALYELWKREDAGPLPTSRHDGRIVNFAQAFRSRLEPLLPQLEQCRNQREVARVRIEGMEVLLVGSDDFDFHPAFTDGLAAVMFSHDALVPPERIVEADIFTEGALDVGEGAALRAALSGNNIILGKNSAVLRWLHADGSIYLSPGSTAYGRLSAGQSIRLERGAGFQRMHAPQIVTVDVDERSTTPYLHVPSAFNLVPTRAHVCQTQGGEDPTEVKNAFASARPRIRIQGNFVLPAGETLNANVIATGEVHVASGARLYGSAKSYKDTVLEKDSCVHGSIVCGETVHLGERCFVTGPVMAERDVLIGRGSSVGGPDALTTISSSSTQIAPECLLHGTVWARVRGSVEG